MKLIIKCLVEQDKNSAREIELNSDLAESKKITIKEFENLTGIPSEYLQDYMDNKKTPYNRIITDIKLIARIGIASRKYYIKDNNLYISGFESLILTGA